MAPAHCSFVQQEETDNEAVVKETIPKSLGQKLKRPVCLNIHDEVLVKSVGVHDVCKQQTGKKLKSFGSVLSLFIEAVPAVKQK